MSGAPVLAALLALALGAAGGGLAMLAGLPLPMLTGSVIAVGAAALSGLRIAGVAPALPIAFRYAFTPVIGVAIGAAVTPDLLAEAVRWWPTLLLLAAFVPAVHWAGYHLIRGTSALDRPTAFFSAVPGGLIESVLMGEAAGADVVMLTMIQFVRVILVILTVPFAFTLLSGGAVGSAGGVILGGGVSLTPPGWALLAVAGAAGALGAKALRFPAWIITGPILLSGALHVAGLVEGAPPAWLVSATQLVIGVTLGGRFAGRSPRIFLTALRLAAVNVAMMLALGGAVAAAFAGIVGEPWEALVLAFAPGGVAEMGLVALSLGASPIYVTAHHIVRILFAVGIAGSVWRRVG